jgi:hypothetical protein
MARFYWIRYDEAEDFITETGSIDDPLPLLLGRLTELDPDSPELVRLSAEIATLDRSADVLAVLDRRDVRRPDVWAAEAHAWSAAPAVVLCCTTDPVSASHRKGYLEALLLLAIAGHTGLPPLMFTYSRATATVDDLTPLLARYGLEHAAAELPPDETFAADFRLAVPAEHLGVWRVTPSQRTRKFFSVYSRMSMALQDALRRWFRYAWLSDLTRFDDHVTARALVLYWLSAPRKAASVAEFGYDVMAPETLDKLCRRTPKIAHEFKEIAERIRAAGYDETARWYSGVVKHIVTAVRRDERSLRRLLAVDSDVLDQLMNFGVAAARIRDRQAASETPARNAIDVVADFGHGLRAQLRRGPLPEWSHDAAVLIMIEATNAMRHGHRLRHGIAVELRILLQDGRRLEFRTEALREAAREKAADDSSSENPAEVDALPS